MGRHQATGKLAGKYVILLARSGMKKLEAILNIDEEEGLGVSFVVTVGGVAFNYAGLARAVREYDREED